MFTFMKEDHYIPSNLLARDIWPSHLPMFEGMPLPFVSHGLGQFAQYDMFERVQVEVASPRQLPSRQSQGAAGYDLKSSEDVVVPARGSAVVDTGVKMSLPKGHYGRVAGRSSLAFKHNVVAFEGTIDDDYRGPIKVKLFNHSDEDYKVGSLTRIAQMIIQPYSTPKMDIVDTLDETERGSGGFGSTGTI